MGFGTGTCGLDLVAPMVQLGPTQITAQILQHIIARTIESPLLGDLLPHSHSVVSDVTVASIRGDLSIRTHGPLRAPYDQGYAAMGGQTLITCSSGPRSAPPVALAGPLMQAVAE